MEDFLNSMKGQVPMLRMLSHMGVQDNSTQTNLRQQFVEKHIQDVNEIEKRVSVRFRNISSAAAIIVMILRSQSFNHYQFYPPALSHSLSTIIVIIAISIIQSLSLSLPYSLTLLRHHHHHSLSLLHTHYHSSDISTHFQLITTTERRERSRTQR